MESSGSGIIIHDSISYINCKGASIQGDTRVLSKIANVNRDFLAAQEHHVH